MVFLYTELAGYFLACAEALGQHSEVASVDVVHWPIHAEAPFQFTSTDHYTLHPKETHNQESLQQLLATINPTTIVCSGWMDADYNAIAKLYRKRIPVVLTLDNWWTGSLRQRLAVLTAPVFIRKRFNRAWVPGKPQVEFAQKLGFAGNALATGFYCADPKPFRAIYEKRKTTQPSKKILFIGRYLDVKGVRELWSAFLELSNEFPDWELHCIGTGELWNSRAIHPKIVHHGFKQPLELEPHLVDAACFVMPSKREPWGVVLHEMAIAGLPLLATRHVGAVTEYLMPDKNGFEFLTANLVKEMKQMIQASEAERNVMGEWSHNLGTRRSPKDWVENLLKLL